jgi:hypothetical protein
MNELDSVVETEVRAPKAELTELEVSPADEVRPARIELKRSELVVVVLLIPKEELVEVKIPDAALVTRTEVAKVELMYGALVEAGMPGVSVHKLFEVLTPKPDEAPHVTV